MLKSSRREMRLGIGAIVVKEGVKGCHGESEGCYKVGGRSLPREERQKVGLSIVGMRLREVKRVVRLERKDTFHRGW